MDKLLPSNGTGQAGEGVLPTAEIVFAEGVSEKQLVWPRCARMRRLLDRAREFAYDDRPLLIHGERGTGKTSLVGMMHGWAAHDDGVLITVPCRDADEEKVYRALAKGARYARGGAARLITVVLDEIAALPASLQQSIANVLKRRTVTLDGITLGGIRLIAVTRTFEGDTEGLTALEVLPLRERREDILPLAERFLRRKGAEDGKAELTLTSRARHALLHHHWPGNVRELRSVAERAAVICTGREVDLADLALPVGSTERWPGGYPSLKELERIYIERVVRESPTLEDAARVLEVDITTLWRKRRRYGL